ncbi:hypothetical protein GCM10007881_63950 [Mesorhizobium huakuii]|uniref:hypothetical protein n=1 Tax=Mesorhizobium huakuii TaxID=28104 RepID=UPI00235CADDB|nr:hypothetical protein [Mesorhizobium huakuii]GLQ82872.1 hypothetical protein GCM10007881_63950 [Mesorhizobium huakuii]
MTDGSRPPRSAPTSTASWVASVGCRYKLETSDVERLVQLAFEAAPRYQRRLTAREARDQAIRECVAIHFAALSSRSEQAKAMAREMRRYSSVRATQPPGSLGGDIVGILEMDTGKPLGKRALMTILAQNA